MVEQPGSLAKDAKTAGMCGVPPVLTTTDRVLRTCSNPCASRERTFRSSIRRPSRTGSTAVTSSPWRHWWVKCEATQRR